MGRLQARRPGYCGEIHLPAWEAGGSGDEAEHLGDMADKRGKRDDAINYYVLSLLSEDPSLTARAKLTALGVKDIDTPHGRGQSQDGSAQGCSQ